MITNTNNKNCQVILFSNTLNLKTVEPLLVIWANTDAYRSPVWLFGQFLGCVNMNSHYRTTDMAAMSDLVEEFVAKFKVLKYAGFSLMMNNEN